MKQKVLITGALGFIMSNLLRRAFHKKEPYDFVCVDKISKSEIFNNIYTNKSLTTHYADICDEHIINRIFEIEQPDIVIHAAALTHVDESLKNPNAFAYNNSYGTQIVASAAAKWKTKKFIYFSTDEYYGQLINDHEEPWTENAPANPRSPYSASKTSGELIVKAMNISFGLPYIIIRPSNNYGMRQTSDKLIPKTIKCILTKTPIPLYGRGLQIRDWMYVEDTCDALFLLMQKGKDNQIYNISANQECSNVELVQKICNLMKDGHNLIEYVNDPRTGHDFRYAIKCEKIRALGWQPSYNLPKGLAKTVEWYILNRWSLK
jgi:dTDP-glucose 4,6-dehydratase